MAIAAGDFIATTRRWRKRRWASRQWICCVLRSRSGGTTCGAARYTGLFFLDEVTALAAGHRPCFECRREDATGIRRILGADEGLGFSPCARDGPWCFRPSGSMGARSARTTCRSTICPTALSVAERRAASCIRGSRLASAALERERILREDPRVRAASRTCSPRRASSRFSRRLSGRNGIPSAADHRPLEAAAQPCGFTFRSVEAGYFASLSAGRIGRRDQFAAAVRAAALQHALDATLQNVHSNEHIIASRESGGRSRSQHSQLGRSASMVYPFNAALMASTVPTSFAALMMRPRAR